MHLDRGVLCTDSEPHSLLLLAWIVSLLSIVAGWIATCVFVSISSGQYQATSSSTLQASAKILHTMQLASRISAIGYAAAFAGIGLGTASRGAAWRAGLEFFPIVPFLRFSIARFTQSAISLSKIGGSDGLSPADSPSASGASSSSSEIVGGLSNGVSQG